MFVAITCVSSFVCRLHDSVDANSAVNKTRYYMTLPTKLNAFQANPSAACHIPVTCCCSSGTTPPSSCAPPSLRPSLLLSGSPCRRATPRDVPARPAPPLPGVPTSHPEWTGCLCRWVVPAGGEVTKTVTTVLTTVCFPLVTSSYAN